MINKKNIISKKNIWKRGGGEFIGFAVTSVLLISLLLLLISFTVLNSADTKLNNVSREIARDIVVCTSIDEARTKAQEEAEKKLSDISSIGHGTIKADVEYAPGSEETWNKGKFVVVTVSARIKTCEPFTSGVRESSTTVMIERNGTGGS